MTRKLIPMIAAFLAATSTLPARDRKIHASPPPPPPIKVVLVHGFLETGDTFKDLRSRLESRGCVCIVPRLTPNDGRFGLEDLAKRLKTQIDAAFGPKEPIRIVGFSMGGLVSRQYLQNLGGAKRCQNLITVSSPHQGTNGAYLYSSVGAKQMRPGSAFLTNLARTQGNLGKMPVASYRTPMDLIILPSSNSIWDRALNIEFPVISHPKMLSSNAVLTSIERRLLH